MDDTKQADETAASEGAEEPLMLCPACGYDLRGSPSGRCPECGLTIDVAAMRESGFPSAHRRKIGRIRAYVRTVWWVAVGNRGLAREWARPQEVRDGRSFRWITAGIVAGSLLAIWGRVLIEQRGLAFVAYRVVPMSATGTPSRPGWEADVTVPWSAGATMPWVIPACLVMLAIYLTGVQQSVFRVGSFPMEYRRRVGAIAHYAAGPMALVLPAVVLLMVPIEILNRVPTVLKEIPLAIVLVVVLVAGVTAGLFATVGTLVRVSAWVARVRHGGMGTKVGAAAELVGLWVLGVVLYLGVVPWCVGFLWVVVDSFR